jgi:hypothetical protein
MKMMKLLLNVVNPKWYVLRNCYGFKILLQSVRKQQWHKMKLYYVVHERTKIFYRINFVLALHASVYIWWTNQLLLFAFPGIYLRYIDVQYLHIALILHYEDTHLVTISSSSFCGWLLKDVLLVLLFWFVIIQKRKK